MTVSSVCPVCGNPQQHGIACSSCCDRLERDLGDVASIVGELDTTMSKQAKIGAGSGTAGLARERMPIGLGAMEAADNLANVLTTWARDVAGESPAWVSLTGRPASTAARSLLWNIDAIRRHPAVNEIVDEITDAIGQARRVVDRPADRIYLGQCMVPTQDDEGNDVTCWEEIYASQGAFETRCKVCGITHVVADRREWLMEQAEDRLFTVREAAQMVGLVGARQITEDRIRGYLRRGRIVFHSTNLIRLGDLLAVVVTEGEKKTA